MEKTLIYHHPRCSKSREALQMLEAKKENVEIREYVKFPLSEAELSGLVKMLGIRPFDLVRTKEAVFKEKFTGKKAGDMDWIKIMAEYPILMERPVVIKNGKAVIGRPPEKILEIL
jgi:arsenate reductase